MQDLAGVIQGSPEPAPLPACTAKSLGFSGTVQDRVTASSPERGELCPTPTGAGCSWQDAGYTLTHFHVHRRHGRGPRTSSHPQSGHPAPPCRTSTQKASLQCPCWPGSAKGRNEPCHDPKFKADKLTFLLPLLQPKEAQRQPRPAQYPSLVSLQYGMSFLHWRPPNGTRHAEQSVQITSPAHPCTPANPAQDLPASLTTQDRGCQHSPTQWCLRSCVNSLASQLSADLACDLG